jgi:hypothetical protein
MEKYATSPELGKVSYENGFVDVGCMVFYFSTALPACKAATWGI